MDMQQVAQRIQAQVDAKTISYDEGLKLLHEAAAIHSGAHVPADLVVEQKPDPRKAEPIKLSDTELLVSALIANGESELNAMKTAIRTAPTDQRAIIDAERNRLQSVADRHAAQKYEQTPEGRLEHGASLAAARAEEAKLVAPAEELLRESGLDDASIAGLSNEDKLVMAGLKEAAPVRRESTSRMVSGGLDETARQIGNEVAASAQEGGGSNAQ